MPKAKSAWACWNYLTASEVDKRGVRKNNVDQVALYVPSLLPLGDPCLVLILSFPQNMCAFLLSTLSSRYGVSSAVRGLTNLFDWDRFNEPPPTHPTTKIRKRPRHAQPSIRASA